MDELKSKHDDMLRAERLLNEFVERIAHDHGQSLSPGIVLSEAESNLLDYLRGQLAGGCARYYAALRRRALDAATNERFTAEYARMVRANLIDPLKDLSFFPHPIEFESEIDGDKVNIRATQMLEIVRTRLLDE